MRVAGGALSDEKITATVLFGSDPNKCNVPKHSSMKVRAINKLSSRGRAAFANSQAMHWSVVISRRVV
jgi:hypothetical protein